MVAFPKALHVQPEPSISRQSSPRGHRSPRAQDDCVSNSSCGDRTCPDPHLQDQCRRTGHPKKACATSDKSRDIFVYKPASPGWKPRRGQMCCIRAHDLALRTASCSFVIPGINICSMFLLYGESTFTRTLLYDRLFNYSVGAGTEWKPIIDKTFTSTKATCPLGHCIF